MRVRRRCPGLIAVGLLVVASCGGDDSPAPASVPDDTPQEAARVADADELIASLAEVLGPCVSVEPDFRDGRQVATCTLDGGAVLEIDVWGSDDATSAAHHLYRASGLVRSIDCVGALRGTFTGWLAGGNWMIASTDGARLDVVAARIGGVALERPDCDRPACDAVDPPWDRIELHSGADGLTPSTVDRRADGAELCITSDSTDMLDMMFASMPEDYDTTGLVSMPVTQREVSGISAVFHGLTDEPPVSTWLETGHHLVVVGPPGALEVHAAAIQLRPDVGPAPDYPTLPPWEVVPEAGPLRFLLPDGGIVSGSEWDGSGEFLLAGQGVEVSLYWTTLAREPFGDFVDDRLDSGSELDPSVVAGFDAIVVAYDTTDHTAMIHDDDYLYEFTAALPEADFRSILDALVVVSDTEWFAAFSPGMATPDGLSEVVIGMLEGVAVPDTFDVESLADLDVAGDRYQIGAAVVDRVVCAWLGQWERHPVGSAEHEQAVAALADAASWPILVEMEREGGFTDVIRQVGDDALGDGDGAAFDYLVSCDA